jgi:hypothetical protein
MRAGTLFSDLPAEQSFRRMEGAVIEPVRIAKKNGLLLKKIEKLPQVAMAGLPRERT